MKAVPYPAAEMAGDALLFPVHAYALNRDRSMAAEIPPISSVILSKDEDRPQYHAAKYG
jgi:hypothetical protein